MEKTLSLLTGRGLLVIAGGFGHMIQARRAEAARAPVGAMVVMAAWQ